MEELRSLAINTAVKVEDLVAMGFDGDLAREAAEELHLDLDMAVTFCMMNDSEQQKLRDERKQIMQDEKKAKRIDVQGKKGLREGKEAPADLFFKAAEESSKKEVRDLTGNSGMGPKSSHARGSCNFPRHQSQSADGEQQPAAAAAAKGKQRPPAAGGGSRRQPSRELGAGQDLPPANGKGAAGSSKRPAASAADAGGEEEGAAETNNSSDGEEEDVLHGHLRRALEKLRGRPPSEIAGVVRSALGDEVAKALAHTCLEQLALSAGGGGSGGVPHGGSSRANGGGGGKRKESEDKRIDPTDGQARLRERSFFSSTAWRKAPESGIRLRGRRSSGGRWSRRRMRSQRRCSRRCSHHRRNCSCSRHRHRYRRSHRRRSHRRSHRRGSPRRRIPQPCLPTLPSAPLLLQAHRLQEAPPPKPPRPSALQRLLKNRPAAAATVPAAIPPLALRLALALVRAPRSRSSARVRLR